jgi:hypothetical protein
MAWVRELEYFYATTDKFDCDEGEYEDEDLYRKTAIWFLRKGMAENKSLRIYSSPTDESRDIVVPLFDRLYYSERDLLNLKRSPEYHNNEWGNLIGLSQWRLMNAGFIQKDPGHYVSFRSKFFEGIEETLIPLNMDEIAAIDLEEIRARPRQAVTPALPKGFEGGPA